MAGKRIVIPNYMPALDLNGNPLAGAKITFYENETTTLASVYANEALTTPLANPVVANLAGVFPSIFADEDLVFTVAITDADDNPIGGLRNKDEVRPSQIFGADSAAAENAAAAAEAFVAEALAIQASGDDAAAIAARAAKNANLSDLTDAAAARTNIGADLAANVNFTPAGTGAVERTMQDKARDVVSVKDFGTIGVGNDTAIINAALAAANTAGGGAATVFFPQGLYLVSSTVVVPPRVKLVGAGARATVFNATFNGVVFSFDSTTNSGLTGARIGLGSNASAVAIDIKTTTGSARDLEFKDLELAGGGIAGQVGIRTAATSGNIITESTFERIVFKEIDNPVIDMDTEGNFWRACTIDQFGYTVGAAIDVQGLANTYEFRVARSVGFGVDGCVAFKNTGARCIASLVVDIGAASTALDLAASANNVVTVVRPEALTPLGTVGVENTVLDTETTITPRRVSNSAAATSGQFTLTDWGNAATVTSIRGDDGRVAFTVNSLGTGQAQFPTIAFTYSKPYPKAPIILAQRGGGTPETGDYFNATETTTGWSMRWNQTPVDGNSYNFVVDAQ